MEQEITHYSCGKLHVGQITRNIVPLNISYCTRIIILIILRVSFCSAIWYCNILAYYLGNILAYNLDKTTLLYKYSQASAISIIMRVQYDILRGTILRVQYDILRGTILRVQYDILRGIIFI
jgi:hypothetical protein